MQQTSVVFLASYELVMSLVFGVTSIVLATHSMNRFVLSVPIEEFIRRKHVPGCLIAGAMIFSVVFLSRGSIEQSTLALQAAINANAGVGAKPLLIAIVHFAVFYLISFGISFLTLYLCSKAYRILMRQIDFDAEIEKKENLGLSIFLVSILIALVLFIDKPMSHFLGSLVFYEHIQRL